MNTTMTPEQLQHIRKTIDENNAYIREHITPDKFVLVREVADRLLHNDALRASCSHEFIEGVCKWCDQQEN